MSIKDTITDNDREKEVKNQQLKTYDIKIQCPDCGNIFQLNSYGEFFCRKCDRIFTEDEIRERCGL